jgi:hypothetical protein
MTESGVINPKVFMSHNWRDKDFVRRLALDLKSAGASVWIDEAEIKIGDSLIEKIRNGIDEVDYLAVILSSRSVDSEWVKKEVDIAMNQEIENKRVKVLPILLEQCGLPGFLKGKLYADFTTEDRYASALALLLDKLGLPSRASTRFPETYWPFNPQLFQDCLRSMEPPLTQEEWKRACEMHSVRDAYSTGDWLLERLTPSDPYYWSGMSVSTCYRIKLLAEIVHEMGRMSWRAEAVRDNLIRQTSDPFGYDPEYSDWVGRRAVTIYTALQTIGDTVSMAALQKRWPNGI